MNNILTRWIDRIRKSDRGIPVMYQQKLTGILGTIIFHLVVVLSIYSYQLNTQENYPEKDIIIEFPDQLKLDQIMQLEELKKDDQKIDEISDQFLRKNIAVNKEDLQKQTQDEISTEKYIEELQQQMELPGFKALRENKSTLQEEPKEENSKDDISLVEKESKKTSSEEKKYTGPTNITYDLKNRKSRYIPVPVYKCQGRGTVVTEIVVNQKGEVIAASVKRDESTAVDECLYETAELYARRTLFNADLSAPSQQHGTLTYQFIAQ